MAIVPITQVIAALPDPPSRADPQNFNARADAFVDAQEARVPAINAWAAQANALAATVNTAAEEAEINALAAASAADAVLSQGSTANAWNSGTTYALHAVAIGSNGRAYRSRQASNTNHNPITDTGTWWLALNPDPALASLLMMAGDMYPDWPMQAQGPIGTYPPTDPFRPACKVWSNGTQRYRARYTWGSSGGGINAPVEIVLEHSANSGTTYSSVTTNNKVTISYSAAGGVIATTWSPA